jgi:hypothetical protein
MKSHLLAIPTNRIATLAITSLGEEARCLQKLTSGRVTVAVVDEGTRKIQEQNRAALMLVAKSLPNATVMHVRADVIDAIASECFAGDATLLNAGTLSNVCYGRATNRLTMLAILLGCDSVHRRDSDVSLDENLLQREAYPVEIELQYLDREAGSGSELQMAAEYPGKPILLVGSGYVGAWAVRYADLAEKDKESAYRLMHLLRPFATRAEVVSFVDQRFFEGNTAEYRKDELAFLKNTMIEAGNMAYHSSLYGLPFSNAVGVAGTDYLYHHVLRRFGYPLLSHNRRLLHLHGTERDSESAESLYHKALIMYACLMRYYDQAYKFIESSGYPAIVNGKINATAVADALESAVESDHSDEESEVLAQYLSVLSNSHLAKYRTIADSIGTQRNSVVGRSRDDARRHARLIRSWEKLVSNLAERKLRGSDGIEIFRNMN